MVEKPTLGMDYGAPPRKMFLVGGGVPDLWARAKFVGIGWVRVQTIADGPPVPAIVLMFEDTAVAAELFDVFKQWDFESNTGQGLDITFIHDQGGRTYQVMFGPNWEEAKRRMVSSEDSENFSVMMAGPTVGRTLPDSEGGVAWLRQEGRDGPVLIVPCAPNRQPLWKHAIKKAEIQFFEKGAVPEELAWLAQDHPTSAQKEAGRVGIAADVEERRGRQMKRFFAVMLARLETNRFFRAAVSGLVPPVERSLCLQAACNLILLERARTPGKTTVDLMEVYEELIKAPENLFDRSPLDRKFSTTELADQIARDRDYLDQYLATDVESADQNRPFQRS